ncbi:toxin-antitoxin system YwqK family antitoxin [Campylobacter coli]|nr:toxin-antitoxin system YwqK family antitoxin [Campylobacter coli]
MTKFLSVCGLIVVLLSGCGGDFPGQPSDVVKVQQNKYSTTGNLKEEIPYNKESRIHGIKRTFYDNGQLKTEESYKNGKRDGVSREYSKDGQLLEEMNFKDNRGYGDYIGYYENGNIRAKGKLLGFDEDGMQEFEGNYKEYYENGTLALEYNFNNQGKMDGLQKSYNQNGSLESEESYKNGIKMDILDTIKMVKLLKKKSLQMAF